MASAKQKVNICENKNKNKSLKWNLVDFRQNIYAKNQNHITSNGKIKNDCQNVKIEKKNCGKKKTIFILIITRLFNESKLQLVVLVNK